MTSPGLINRVAAALAVAAGCASSAGVGAHHSFAMYDLNTTYVMTGVVTRANMQPAVACYRQMPGEAQFKPLALDVIRIEGGTIREITTFPAELFPAFGLPEAL